ncbi:PaaI family thioesterase [Algivirga pacifica]|uniref:Acyl-coenzyme A thioesterase THEM4 n=1 Tax=Algivirga pacifica TaxID=1162670 RepID=A0ABP9D0M3_9BACT
MQYFQDYMHGNVCFGCGTENPEGLQIKSYWEGDRAICIWESEKKYHGWANLMAGGIIATIIDCHCMGFAMADAYKREGRELDSLPAYRYATGTMNIKYLLPTPNNQPVKLIAWVTEVKGRKTVIQCEVWSGENKTAEAEVIGIRVFDSSKEEDKSSIFAEGK